MPPLHLPGSGLGETPANPDEWLQRGSAGSEGCSTHSVCSPSAGGRTRGSRLPQLSPPAAQETSYGSASCFTHARGLGPKALLTAEGTQGPLAGECSCLYPTLARGKATSSHGGGNMYNSSTAKCSCGLSVARVTWVIKAACSLL